MMGNCESQQINTLHPSWGLSTLGSFIVLQRAPQPHIQYSSMGWGELLMMMMLVMLVIVVMITMKVLTMMMVEMMMMMMMVYCHSFFSTEHCNRILNIHGRGGGIWVEALVFRE